MGIDTDRFVETVPQEALCPVCCLVLEEPISTSCGHYMCKNCWEGWVSSNKKDICPYCCSPISTKGIKSAVVVKGLISNFNVYCKYVRDGCTVVHKLGLEDVHLHKCAFAKDRQGKTSWNPSHVSNGTCSDCQLSLDDSTLQPHNCLQALSATCKRLGNQVVNLEYENEKLSLRLTQRENDDLDHVTEIESLYQQNMLHYEKEIRQLRLQLTSVETDLSRIRSESEEVIRKVTINRRNGTLGFNIIGGFQEGKSGGSDIIVSRIEERSAADEPGKLKLHDKIVEVNGINLENASHDEAVKAFKCTKDPVEVVVKRQVRRDPPEKCDNTTQTELTENSAIENSQMRRPKSCELTDSPSLSCSEEDCVGSRNQRSGRFNSANDELLKPVEFYDSAYDTLLTQRSSKSTKSSSFSSEVTRDEDINLNENDDIIIDFNGNEADVHLTSRRVGDAYCDSVKSGDSSGSSILFSSGLAGDSSTNTLEKNRNIRTNKHDHSRPVRRDLNSCSCGSSLVSPRTSPRKFVKKNVFYFVADSESAASSPRVMRKEDHMSVPDTESRRCGNSSATLSGTPAEFDPGAFCESLGDIADGYEYEYEEICLAKRDGRFGFELCYGGDEESLAVYVGEIEEDSVAERDGRIMVGDQIVMINNSRASVVEEAYRILQENNEVTLLVARPVYEGNSPEIDEETDLDLIDYPLETVKEETSGTEATLLPSHSDSNSVTVTSNGKLVDEDLKAVRGADKIVDGDEKSVTVIETDIGANTLKETFQSSPFSLNVEGQGIKAKSNENMREKKPSDTKEDLKSTLKRYVLARLRGESEAKVSAKSQGAKDISHVENPKKRDPTLQKGQIFENSSALDKDIVQLDSVDSAPRRDSGPSKDNGSLLKGKCDDKSTSRSTESRLRPALKKSDSKSSSKKQVRVDVKSHWTSTEKRVWEEFKLIQSMEAQEKNEAWGQPDRELEWKVRRSKDGKHIYIRKQSKPAKAKLLKERAQRVAEERRGITTDEDTQSVYLGKYWTREERRHQLNRQREKRRRLLQRINEKNSINGVEAAIAEIVQRNMTSPGKIFDDFLTVEEILMQRNRDGITEGPIQVTTV